MVGTSHAVAGEGKHINSSLEEGLAAVGRRRVRATLSPDKERWRRVTTELREGRGLTVARQGGATLSSLVGRAGSRRRPVRPRVAANLGKTAVLLVGGGAW